MVDDEPVPLSTFLPVLARWLGAPEPGRMDESVARSKFGDLRVYYWNQQRGASNMKAKRDLDWHPMYPSWRHGFAELYQTAPETSGG